MLASSHHHEPFLFLLALPQLVVLRPLVDQVDEVPRPVLDVGVALVEVPLDGEPIVIDKITMTSMNLLHALLCFIMDLL